jgi:hypothetical protein
MGVQGLTLCVGEAAGMIAERSVGYDERSLRRRRAGDRCATLLRGEVGEGLLPGGQGSPGVHQAQHWGIRARVLWLSTGAVVLLLVGIIRFAIRGERHLGTSTQRATYQALHTANLAAPALRTGLHGAGASRSIVQLHSLLGSRGVILADLEGVLASEGIDAVHREPSSTRHWPER